MSEIKTIAKGNDIYALSFSKETKVDGAKFMTQQTMPFQVGLIERPKGYEVKAHQHPPQKYDVQTMSEFLYVEKGQMEVTIYDEEWVVIEKITLSAGDAMLSLRGGHSMTVTDDIRFFEVKQGPFPGDKASKVFRPNA